MCIHANLIQRSSQLSGCEQKNLRSITTSKIYSWDNPSEFVCDVAHQSIQSAGPCMRKQKTFAPPCHQSHCILSRALRHDGWCRDDFPSLPFPILRPRAHRVLHHHPRLPLPLPKAARLHLQDPVHCATQDQAGPEQVQLLHHLPPLPARPAHRRVEQCFSDGQCRAPIWWLLYIPGDTYFPASYMILLDVDPLR